MLRRRYGFACVLLLGFGCQSDRIQGLRAASTAEPEPAAQPEPPPEPVPVGLVDGGPEPEPVNTPAPPADAGQDAGPEPEPTPSPVRDAGDPPEPEVPPEAGPSDDSGFDACPADDTKTEPGVCGCGTSDVDTDEDGAPDCEDECPEHAEKTEPGVCGCDVPDVDTDADLVFDCDDQCPGDALKSEPGVCGCDVAEDLLDTDGDMTPDCIDACPNGEVVSDEDVCGCGVSDDPTDSDGDGAADCVDLCPADPNKTEPGECTCGVAESSADTDTDGTLDCLDGCPADASKTAPGVCGCGVAESETDDDADGTPNCIDGCPADATKTAPLTCGCGVAEDVDDPDGDGTPDCLDGCPTDATKTSPGSCGCGLAENPHCATLQGSLVARYGFNGTGTNVLDSIGGKNGTAVNAAMNGNGVLALAGGTTDQYVDLPNDLLSGLSNATFEVWFNWTGGSAWQRVFDFGTSDQAEGTQGNGTSFLFLTCAPNPRAAFRPSGQAEVSVTGTIATSTTASTHVAVVFDDTGNTMVLYVNGVVEGNVATTFPLSSVVYSNNWFGRSQYLADPEFGGQLREFRIYDVALSATQVEDSFELGPSPAFLP